MAQYLRGISKSLDETLGAHQRRGDTVRTPAVAHFQRYHSDILRLFFDAYTPIHSIMRKLRRR